jgi:hypothetical protein
MVCQRLGQQPIGIVALRHVAEAALSSSRRVGAAPEMLATPNATLGSKVQL